MVVGSFLPSPGLSAPNDGDIIECDNSSGGRSLFEVLDTDDDPVYAAWVLKEAPGSDFRVGFNNKHERDIKATSILVHSEAEGGGELDEDYVNDSHDSTGDCGAGPFETYTAPGVYTDVEVQVWFSGLVVSTTEEEGESVSHEESSTETRKWEVSAEVYPPTAGGSYSGEKSYGSTDITEWSASSSVTWTSDEHNFGQTYRIDWEGDLHAT